MFESFKQKRATRMLLQRSLAQIVVVESGEAEKPVYITTAKGLFEATPVTAGDLVAGIKRDWGEKYPGLFSENGGLPDGFIRLSRRLGIIPVEHEVGISTTTEK